MTREEAIKKVRQMSLPKETMEILETLAPELNESEDERIRKALIDALKVSETIGELKFKLPYPTREECIAYLEKQKNLDKMIVVSPEVWDGAINDAYENGKKDSEKQKEQKPLSTEETELNSLAFLEQMGYTCIPPKKKEHQNNSDAPKNVLGGALNSPLDKDKNLDDIAQDYVEAVKEYNPELTWNLMQTAVCYGYHYREEEEQKSAEWKPQPESLEALMYAIEGKWDMISPTSYLSRRLEDLYDGLVNTYNVDESLLDELPKVASRTYTAEDIEELKELKKKIEASMDEKPAECSDTNELVFQDICKHLKEEGFGGWVVLLNALRNGEFQFKRQWSEEDEKMLDAMIDIVSNSLYEPLCPREGMLDWLKSLRPQPHWKPSKEEIDAFENLLKGEFPNKIFPGTTLANLLNKLKKLYYNEAIQVWKPNEEQN